MKGIKSFGPNKRSKFEQGHFDDYNPRKYKGPRPIIYRSSWEKKFFIRMEMNPDVEWWSSEPFPIPYFMKEKNQSGKIVMVRHNYYPDVLVKMKDKIIDGKLVIGKTFLIEIKPNNQVPLNESMMRRDPVMYKNSCKWSAAIKYCKNQQNMEFKLITETHLDLKTKIL